MKTMIFCVLVSFFAFAESSTMAGTLDPSLAALLIKKMPTVRSATNNQPPPLNPFEPRLDNVGRVQVYVHPANAIGVQIVATELQALGAAHIVSSPVMRVVQAWVPRDELSRLASLTYISRVGIPTYAVARRKAPLLRSLLNRNGHVMTRSVPTGLAIDSQALTAMQASLLIANGVTGAGVKVGVISDDNSGLAASQAAGYLPSSVWADPNFPGTTPTPGDPAEGTAMLEEVHAMAPGASLGFCAPQTSVDLLTCYNDFITWGATVITDDLQFSGVDMFSAGLSNDGSLAYAVSQITQTHPNVAFTSAGGNDAQDYFQAVYTPGAGATINGINYVSLMDFGIASGGSSSTQLSVQFDTTSTFAPSFQWNDALKTSPDILDIFLVNSSGAVLATGIVDSSSDGRTGESFSYTPATVGEIDFIEIACQSCANPITFKLNGNGDGAISFGLVTGGSVGYGQTIAPGVLTTVAAQVYTQNPLSIYQEVFSATGPYFYGSFGATDTETRPNLTGIDNVTVSGAGGFAADNPASGGGVLFSGTSATGPNVAALIADIMSGNTEQTASVYYTALENAANQSVFQTYTLNAAGSGLAQGVAAWDSISSNLIPYISGLNPTSAIDVNGSFTLTVEGIGFMNGSVVNFNGTSLSTTFVGPTTITAAVPASADTVAGTVNVSVTNPSPGNMSSSVQTFTIYNPAAGLDSITPNYVMLNSPSVTITVNGAGFVNGVTAALLDDGGELIAALPTTFVSSDQIIVTIPSADIVVPGIDELAVANPSPVVPGINYNGPSFLVFNIYSPIPSITSIDPACMAVGGPTFTFTINGTNFINGAYGTSVSIVANNEVYNLSATVVSPTQITALIPTTEIGPMSSGFSYTTLGVANVNSQVPGASQNIPVLASNQNPPSIVSLTPSTITAGSAGFTLTVNADGFSNGTVVDFNSILLPTSWISPSQLQAIVPASAITKAGNYPVTLMNPSPDCGYSNTETFDVLAPPTPPPPAQPPPASPPAQSSGGAGGSIGLIQLLALGLCLIKVRRRLKI